MDKNGRRVTRFKDMIIAVDESRNIKSANLSPQAIKKAAELKAKVDRKNAEIEDLNAEIKELTAEQFKKYGGVETEEPRVTDFPNPDMKAGLVRLSTLLAKKPEQAQVIRAGIIEVLKSMWNKFKTIFSGLDELEQDVNEYTQLAAA